jgi:hypothetical protein
LRARGVKHTASETLIGILPNAVTAMKNLARICKLCPTPAVSRKFPFTRVRPVSPIVSVPERDVCALAHTRLTSAPSPVVRTVSASAHGAAIACSRLLSSTLCTRAERNDRGAGARDCELTNAISSQCRCAARGDLRRCSAPTRDFTEVFLIARARALACRSWLRALPPRALSRSVWSRSP